LTPLILHARQVNATQPLFVIEKIRQAIGGLAGKQIAALGLAYKPDVDDLRESPAVEVVHLLTNQGARVRAYEPFKPEADLKGIESVSSLQDALANADAILLLVNHTQFREMDPAEIAGMTPARVVIDVVHGWDDKPWSDAGFRFFRLGANKAQPLNQKS